MLFEHLKERKEILVVVFLNYWFGMLWFVIYFVFEKLKVFGVENMDRKLWGFQNWSEENIYKWIKKMTTTTTTITSISTISTQQTILWYKREWNWMNEMKWNEMK
jgi:hypothetical protein